MYNFAKWMQYYNLPVKSLSPEFRQLFSVFFPNFPNFPNFRGGRKWLVVTCVGQLHKRAPVQDAPPRMGTVSMSINSLDSAQRFHNKASLCKDNTSMPHL
jgi:hypothetical protein